MRTDNRPVPGAEATGSLSRDEQRHALLAECRALEQRWIGMREQVVGLDAEWQRLVDSLKRDGESVPAGRSLDWASGALLFHDLNQYAARLSGLTAEALQTCNQYARALHRAMEGLDV